MAMHLSDENDTPGRPAGGPPDMGAEKIANEEAWAAWEAKGRGSSRPPWWLLILGLLALGVVYWLWGGVSGGTR